MTARRSNPLVMMGCLGVMAVVFFGGGVWWMSDKPIIRLRPLLEKTYGAHGFRCSLHINEGRLDVEVPATLALDRFEQRRVGAEAWRNYLKLTKGNTQVVAVQVLPGGEMVTREQAERSFTTDSMRQEIERVAAEAGGPPSRVVVAPGVVAAPAVVLDVGCDDAAVRKIATALLKLPDVGYVQVRRSGKIVQESGADVKLYATATIAPVGSPAR